MDAVLLAKLYQSLLREVGMTFDLIAHRLDLGRFKKPLYLWRGEIGQPWELLVITVPSEGPKQGRVPMNLVLVPTSFSIASQVTLKERESSMSMTG